jgi:hypothetical protein
MVEGPTQAQPVKILVSLNTILQWQADASGSEMGTFL